MTDYAENPRLKDILSDLEGIEDTSTSEELSCYERVLEGLTQEMNRPAEPLGTSGSDD